MIINRTKAKANVNLWKSTSDVLQWYKEIQDKPKCKFLSFDIVEFYPSISRELLRKALDHASQYDEIKAEEREIIFQAKDTLVFSNGEPWIKKGSNCRFDVTMGSFDGAETCELVVCFLLTQIQLRFGKDIGLYRDDGLGVLRGTPKQNETVKKNICKIFRDHNLKITVEANLDVVNFLDVTLNLVNETFMPYMKENNTPQYVHVQSNHPHSVIKAIPISINKRLSEISSSQDIFNRAAPAYQEALAKSGYTFKLKYQHSSDRKRRNRPRDVIWFNPPFNLSVETNIGNKFLQLVEQCFTMGHPMRKIFNRNTVKISYSCMPNMDRMIQSSNKAMLAKNRSEGSTDSTQSKLCNCRKGTICPVNGQCLKTNLIYRATVHSEGSEESYIGLTSTEFKSRFNGHKCSFNDIRKKNSTELSKHIWKLKDEGRNYEVKWSIMGHAKPYDNISKRCNLCNLEKFYIICKAELASLNKRTELVSKCRHEAKYMLANTSIT